MPNKVQKYLKKIINDKEALIGLVFYEFKKQYLGSYVGVIWVFLQPIFYMLVIMFVLTLGMRANLTQNNENFALWLLLGLIVWFFISESIRKGAECVVRSSYLVKKPGFTIEYLPIISVIAASMTHIVLFVILIFALLVNDIYPTIYWVQIPYFMILGVLLVSGFVFLLSALRVFVKDISNIVIIIMQFLFWTTPIFWSTDLVPERFKILLSINPFHYIIDGYRSSIFKNEWVLLNVTQNLFFLMWVLLVLSLGLFLFRRLKAHFADML
ncbi:ABC transporter permease [Nitrincola tapanii]|uniref:Transport permease protein n=1 Tax=Nitrincola tapanii TaxID=1708751 RepID=A0A5A9W105_9GAMM|nr:ABC transporter permease [Nitrincola tapanii]KAA0874406.1 ABC transporter permease [Nitrincola tapanii]